MSGRYENQHEHKRKRRPKWLRMLRKYWPPIRFGLICLLLLLLIIGFISLIVNLFATANQEKDKHDISETNVSDETSSPSGSTMSAAERQAQLIYLMNESASMAAGYDYRGAINLLKAYEDYESNVEMQQRVAKYEQLDSQLVSYDQMNNITHVFFHSLIVDPSRAFDGEYTESGYNQYMTTIDEFIAMMESMYEKGYVLVSPYDVAYEVTDSTGTHFTYGDIRLPEGKIPFIMSQDDLNYYGYMIGDVDQEFERPAKPTTSGDGFAHKVVIGKDGYPTCEYMDADGNITTGDYDLVPVLEKFIQEHPDFSYHGARAVLGMTGYEGVFGYRTKPSYEEQLGSAAYQKEIEDARAVADCLRNHGWILASHSYGHPSYGELTAERVESDSDKWEETVQSVIGDCDIILYPNGF